MRIEVLIAAQGWDAANLQGLADATGACVAAHCDLPRGAECALLACDDARIADLNQQFRQKAAATNVLSWPSADLAAATDGGQPHAPSTPALGDIALAFETCRAEARGAGIPFDHHITHLILHGILHLLGYDHISEGDAQIMEGLEIEMLRDLGIDNPYVEESVNG